MSLPPLTSFSARIEASEKGVRVIIEIINQPFSVCKVEDYSQANLDAEFFFIGKTDRENSLVCLTQDVPANTTDRTDGWRAFRIQGQLDFALIGILAEISRALANASVGIFAVSTYETDYILVREAQFEAACEALRSKHFTLIDLP